MAIPEHLQGFAARLAKITPKCDEHTTPLNFAVGAVHALAKAHDLKYDGRRESGRGQRIWQLASELARDLSKGGEFPTDGDWLAGYYFNNAIIRIAVSFEHIFRHVTNKHGRESINVLLTEAATRDGFEDRWGKAWSPFHDELNAIRHRDTFVDGPKPEVDYAFAVDALDKLIETLEWGVNHKI